MIMELPSQVDHPDIHQEVPLAGYTDRLSARPGDTIKFRLSSLAAKRKDPSTVTARLKRCVSADPNPKGPGIIEKDSSQWFAPREILVSYQKIPRGSYACTNENVSLRISNAESPDQSLPDRSVFDTISNISVSIWFFPTLVKSQNAGSSPPIQTIWQWSNLCRLIVTPSGHLEAYPVGRVGFCRTRIPLKTNRWYHIVYTLALEENRLQSCNLKVDALLEYDRQFVHTAVTEDFDPPEAFSGIVSPFELAKNGTLNGRLEDPSITVTGILASSLSKNETTYDLAVWDTSRYQAEDPWTIPCRSQILSQEHLEACPLILYHHPTRAVRGRKWDGTELSWRHKPSHYGAIHFHDDDVYDFGWEDTFSWTVPEGMPSGIYIARFEDEELNEESLPLFICPPKRSTEEANSIRKMEKKLAVIIPTFTYVMYGNHARPDFERDLWIARGQSSSGSYPHNPAMYPAYGWSTYNFHSDAFGIHFASHLRPLFNLRPGYITFSRLGGYNDDSVESQKHSQESFCSGLRHFPADSHLIAWLHHQGFDYDIVTDHELHREGVSVLAPYTTIMTTSHPEYHTLESLEAYQRYRDDIGGNLMYLGGNGFYWRIAASTGDGEQSCKLLEIRRCESGVRTWAAGKF
jgi:N,N-dimethylformamidase